MKTVDQISRGVAHFFDTEVRPSLNGTKGILYGMAVGVAMNNAGKIVAQYMPTMQLMGIADGSGQIDVEALGAELKKQMRAGGGELVLNVGIGGKDQFTFRETDVDRLIEAINRM